MSKIHSSEIHSTRARSRSRKIKARKIKAKPARNYSDAAQDAPARKPFHPRVFAATWFSFHRLCKEPACRRAQTCAGGADPPCFRAFWRHVPERHKIMFRETIDARAKGLSVEEAMAAGEAAAVRYEALMAQLDAQDARTRGEEPRPAAAVTKATPPSPAVRVRSL